MTSLEQKAPKCYIIKITAEGLLHHQAVCDQSDLDILNEVLEKIKRNASEAALGVEGNGEGLPVEWATQLITAAQALINRWESPLWKDVPHTGEFIHALKAAVERARNHVASPSVDQVMEVVGLWMGPGDDVSFWSDDGGNGIEAKLKADLRDRLEQLLKNSGGGRQSQVGHELFAGVWHAWFSIGNQRFRLSPIRSEEGENGARWQAEMLRSAFGIPRIGDVPEQQKP